MTLVDSEQEAGYYDIELNASMIPSGVYFYQIQTESYRAVRKMMLVK